MAGIIIVINYNPATSDQQKLTNPCGKSQPWKANWPPANAAGKSTSGIDYPTDAEGSALIDGIGMGLGGITGGVGSLNYSPPTGDKKDLTDMLSTDGMNNDNKQTDTKTNSQPWKAYWPAANNAAEKGGLATYRTDANSSALVDGDVNFSPATGDMPALTDLLHGRSQPWKAQWSPVNQAKDTAVTCRTDANGSALVDGQAFNPPTGGMEGLTDLLDFKSQPWKVQASPVSMAEETAVAYLTDAKGCALVDGF